MVQNKENVDSAVSYGVGAFSTVIAMLPQIANTAQNIAIILGCLVVAVRLAHDVVRFVRFFKQKTGSAE